MQIQERGQESLECRDPKESRLSQTSILQLWQRLTCTRIQMSYHAQEEEVIRGRASWNLISKQNNNIFKLKAFHFGPLFSLREIKNITQELTHNLWVTNKMLLLCLCFAFSQTETVLLLHSDLCSCSKDRKWWSLSEVSCLQRKLHHKLQGIIKREKPRSSFDNIMTGILFGLYSFVSYKRANRLMCQIERWSRLKRYKALQCLFKRNVNVDSCFWYEYNKMAITADFQQQLMYENHQEVFLVMQGQIHLWFFSIKVKESSLSLL